MDMVIVVLVSSIYLVRLKLKETNEELDIGLNSNKIRNDNAFMSVYTYIRQFYKI